MVPHARALHIHFLLALALLFSLNGFAPKTASAATRDVCSSGCTYNDIQAAINAAVPGDTISIAAGSYSGLLSIAKNLTLQGAGASQTNIVGSGFGSVITIAAGATVRVTAVTITGGVAPDGGGGIFNAGTLTLAAVAVTNSRAYGNSLGDVPGGGIYNRGTLTVTASTISGNRSDLYGGGIANEGSLTVDTSTLSDNVASYGSGIENDWGSTATIRSSTISGNFDRYEKGGDGIANFGMLTVINSTITGNGRGDYAAGNGGGILNVGALAIQSSTISGNLRWGLVNSSTSTTTLVNTILAANMQDCRLLQPVTDTGGNLAADASCSFTAGTSRNSTDPQLGPLADNGGPTQTQALLPGSPAIDAGINCPPPATDQRGIARPQGRACDSGAYEVVTTFRGFFQPVDNLPTVNIVKSGAAVPVKFSLTGNRGLNIFAAGYPVSQQVSCSTGVPTDDIEQTATAGNSGLSYDAASDTYSYIWKTEKAWSGQCRQLVVKLTDGSEHIAGFQFR